MSFSLTWLPEVLEDAGLRVAEQPGWRSRGRREMGAVKGVMCHHTSGSPHGIMPSLGIITHGRPDLNGPLSQLALGRDGTFFVVAAGRCNHAGAGMWQGFSTGNANFIGIEAENTGLPDDPWPTVQLDAYRRGVAAILGKIGANPVMCCGHKEYALPPGRKDDPSFDMFDFRDRVANIMAGNAPAPVMIPRLDGAGRPTLSRGVRGDLVRQIETRLKLPADGIFGPAVEAAVRQFQRENGLVPDGIIGPRTWASLETTRSGTARPAVTERRATRLAAAVAKPGAVLVSTAGPKAAKPGATAKPGARRGAARLGTARLGTARSGAPRRTPRLARASPLDRITDMAAASALAQINWRDRGQAPVGYIKGMALVYGRVYCKFKAGDAAALDMAQKNTGLNHDALAWYGQVFRHAGMDNSVSGVDTLRHLFVLLIGLGMRESSGRYCEGRDRSAHNVTANKAEAGLFQTSFDARSASPLLPQIYAHYKVNPSGFVDVFKEGIKRCSATDLENFGSGEGKEFQRLSKECPAFAAEFAAVGLRHRRTHWGPIKKQAAQVRRECDELLKEVQAAVDASPALAGALA
jgi:peptidoglycan hydrolase-like protein with peptidoglycan-binding domain